MSQQVEYSQELARNAPDTNAQLLASFLDRAEINVVTNLIQKIFSWARFLSKEDQLLFAREYVDTFGACHDLQVWAPLGQLIHEWKATAAVAADPELSALLTTPIDTDS